MFIVLDGIDGAGKGRQREEILAKLSNNPRVDGEEFPVHNSFYKEVVHPALQGESKLNNSSWVLSYLLDKTMQTERIKPFKEHKTNLFLADGYFTTTIAYQSFLMNQIELTRLLEYADEFNIIKPDLAIFIDVDPEIARQRKKDEEGHEEGPDMFEKSIAKQKKLQKIFRNLVEDRIYCDWVKVDGNRDILSISDDIIKILKKKGLSFIE